MVKAYEGKLSEFVIPVEELGFDPLVPNNIEWKFKFNLSLLFLRNIFKIYLCYKPNRF